MHTHLFVFVKTFIKSSLDNYILPGTLTGSEILWLYLTQWKRDLASIVFASYFFFSENNLKFRSFNTFFSPEELDNRDTQVPVERT